MKKKLVLAGGGHAHMVTLANLRRFVDQGHAVTVIQPSEHHYYSGMGPGMLGGTYMPDDIRFATRRQVEKKGGSFVLGKVAKIDASMQNVHLESGEAVSYDVLSCNLGSFVPRDMITGSTLMPGHPSGVRKRALHALDRQGIEIVKNCHVREIRTGCMTGESGKCRKRIVS